MYDGDGLGDLCGTGCFGAAHKAGVLDKCREVEKRLAAAGVRVKLDDSDNSPGWKFNEWEMKGVPVRLELGPRDIENGKMVCVRRDTHEKAEYALENAESVVTALLENVQKDMLESARAAG